VGGKLNGVNYELLCEKKLMIFHSENALKLKSVKFIVNEAVSSSIMWQIKRRRKSSSIKKSSVIYFSSFCPQRE
jgi:hypothetical protein